MSVLGRNVFTFWEGRTPGLIEILLNLMKLHCDNTPRCNLHILNYQNMFSYVSKSELPQHFFELCFAYQADILRVILIKKYGGIWLDADTLLTSELTELFNIIDNNKGFFITEPQCDNYIECNCNKPLCNQICNGVFGFEKNSTVLTEWLDIIYSKLNTNKRKHIAWTELGSRVLNDKEFKNNIPVSVKIFKGKDTMYPVPWRRLVHELCFKNDLEHIKKDFQPILILVGSVYRFFDNRKLRGDNLLRYQCNLTKLIKQSYKNTKYE